MANVVINESEPASSSETYPFPLFRSPGQSSVVTNAPFPSQTPQMPPEVEGSYFSEEQNYCWPGKKDIIGKILAFFYCCWQT